MKTFKKILCAAAACAILINSYMPARKQVAADSFRTAGDAVSQITVGWNLGNTFDANGTWITGDDPTSYETAWGNPVTTKAMIDSVREQGFNALRLPVTWSQHIDEHGNVDEKWMARIKEVVDYAYDDGMFVILNVHHDTGEGGDDKVSWIFADTGVYENVKDKYKNLWTDIANEFKDYGDRLMFEGYNEMLDTNNTWNASSNSTAYEAVNNFAQDFVDAVRATGGNNAERNLIVNTYVSSYDQAVLDNFKLPTDSAKDHLIVEVHSYAPWGFTGTTQSVTWTTVHNDFNDSDKSEIDAAAQTLANFSNKLGVPVIVGEFGAECKNNDAEIAKYAEYMVQTMDSHGIKCFYWDNGDFNSGEDADGGYAIFNRNSMTWKTEIVSAMIGAAGTTQTGESEATEATTETTVEETTAETTTAVETTASSEEEQAEETSVFDESQATAVIADAEDDGPAKDYGLVPFVVVDCVLVAAAVALVIVYNVKKNKKHG